MGAARDQFPDRARRAAAFEGRRAEPRRRPPNRPRRATAAAVSRPASPRRRTIAASSSFDDIARTPTPASPPRYSRRSRGLGATRRRVVIELFETNASANTRTSLSCVTRS